MPHLAEKEKWAEQTSQRAAARLPKGPGERIFSWQEKPIGWAPFRQPVNPLEICSSGQGAAARRVSAAGSGGFSRRASDVALVAGLLGFTEIAGTAAVIAQVLFFIFLAICIIMFIMAIFIKNNLF